MNILFFVQIILELLPISSSGHLKIICKSTKNLFNLSFIDEIIAHFPTTIIQLFFLFYLLNLQNSDLQNKLKNLFNISISAIPTSIIIIFVKKISRYIYLDIPIYYGLAITSYFLFSLSNLNKENYDYKKNKISLGEGLLLGLIQGFAIFPGVSRFALFLFACKKMKFSNQYSFFLAMASNISLSMGGLFYLFVDIYILNNNYNYNFYFNINDLIFLFLSILIAILMLSITYKLYKKNKFFYFGIYEFLLSIYCFIKSI